MGRGGAGANREGGGGSFCCVPAEVSVQECGLGIAEASVYFSRRSHTQLLHDFS